MMRKELNTEFLNKLANVLAKRVALSSVSSSINKLFKTYLNLQKTEFIIWDDNNMVLKNFEKDKETVENNEFQGEINYIYNSLAVSNGTKFYFNEEEFDCEIKDDEQYRILDLNSEENNIIFPLVSNGEVFGVLNITCSEKAFTKEFFEILNIASKLISGTLINNILNEQMEVSLNFYRAMKDIAKIIESQYELSYIIPLIGEKIDRFMPNHLIYIFVYNDNKFSLVWPKACKDENVHKLLNKVTHDSEYILSKNHKIGIFPLVNEENILGAIAAYSNIDKLLQKDIDYLVQLTRQSGLTIHRANVYAEVLKYATLDALTGLNNRRQFEIRIKQEVSNSKRNNTPLCCIMADVDYFKKVNDTYGHAAGDCVLKKIAEVIMREIREYDIACRYGGEEFFIILPQTKLKEAALVAQRLRKVIENTKIDITDCGTNDVPLENERFYIKVTSSLGVCAYDTSMDAAAFANKADKALYEAKETGRNRVIVADEISEASVSSKVKIKKSGK